MREAKDGTSTPHTPQSSTLNFRGGARVGKRLAWHFVSCHKAAPLAAPTNAPGGDVRGDDTQGATAIVMPRVHPPQFGWQDGDQAAVLQGHRGALHAMLLLLLFAHTREGGSLGGVSLDSHLHLAGLFKPEQAK